MLFFSFYNVIKLLFGNRNSVFFYFSSACSMMGVKGKRDNDVQCLTQKFTLNPLLLGQTFVNLPGWPIK